MFVSLFLISNLQIVFAGEIYKGKEPPSIQYLQVIVSSRITDKAKIIGLHKERDGEYLVITNVDYNNYGGPYRLLRLETNEWVIHNQSSGLGGTFELVGK